MTSENLSLMGVRARRNLPKDLLHAFGYCTDCGNVNDRAHIKRTCSKCLRDAKKYYEKNKATRAAKLRAWAKANPERLKEVNKLRARKLKQDVINAYGKVCRCCLEANITFLCLDHVNGGGLKHRNELRATSSGQFYSYLRAHKYPMDPPLQVLCYNCNQGKQINGGVCPHQEKA